MTDKQLLTKLGFKEHSRRRRGCIVSIYWFDFREGDTKPQHWLAARERRRIQAAKSKGATP